MLIINEKDISNRKDSIKLMLNYYIHQMTRKNVLKADIDNFTESCNSLIQTLENLSKTIINIYSANAEKHAALINQVKKDAEIIFLESKVQQNDLVSLARRKMNKR